MKRINLLPQEARVKASRERGLIWAILILVAVVVVLGLVYVKFNSDVGAKEDELAAIQAETATVQAKIAELSPYAALQAQRTAMTETAKGIYESSVPFSILLQELSLVIPENVRLQTMTATVPTTMLPGAAPAAAPAGAVAAADVTFSGQTEKHKDVAEFMTRLGLIPQLMSITLTSSTDASGTTVGDYRQLRAHGIVQAVHGHRTAAPVHDGATCHHASGGGAMRARGREIYIITAVVAIVLIVAWYFLLFSPTQRKLSDLDQQVQSAQSSLDIAKQEVVKLESYKKTAPQSRAEIVRLGKMLPESEGIPGLIIELSKTADASGVAVTSIARGTTAAGESVRDPDAEPAGHRTLLRRRGLPLPPRGVRRLPQRELQGHRQAASGDAALDRGFDDVEHRRFAAARGDDWPERVPLGWSGTNGGRWRCAMSQNRRVLTYIAIALIVGAALALAVALSNSGAGTSGATATSAGDNALATTVYSDSGDGGACRRGPGQGAAAPRQVHEQGPVHPVPDAGGDVYGGAQPEPDEHRGAVEPVREGEGGRDVLQRDAG